MGTVMSVVFAIVFLISVGGIIVSFKRLRACAPHETSEVRKALFASILLLLMSVAAYALTRPEPSNTGDKTSTTAVTPVEESAPPAPKATAPAPPASPQAQLICTAPGIGDNLSEFADKHTLSRNSGMISNYDKDRFLIVSADGKMINITVSPKPSGEMDPLVDQMIPTDAKETSSRTDTSDDMVTKRITTYKSAKLSEAFPAKKGEVVRFDRYDARTNKYLSTVLSLD